MLKELQQTVKYIQEKISSRPSIGIVLGTGLGGLVDEVDIRESLAYETLPHFPVSTVSGHRGRLLFGKIGDKEVVIMDGRFHYYEGYTMQQITFPIRVMKMLGMKNLIISNACGGMNPAYKVGDIMFIDDHINLFPDSPLRGENSDELGPRFPDMSEAYSKKLIEKALQVAQKNKLKVHTGVYAGLMGPCFETPAEYRYLRRIGADVVGMSTVPEVIVARHMGVECFGISVITDLGIEGRVETITHEEVKKAAAEAEPKMTAIVMGLVMNLD